MRFYALLSTVGNSLIAEFPDCPGCVAVAGPNEDIGRNASAVLRSWLEARLLAAGIPPVPTPQVPRRPGARARAIEVPTLLALRIHTRHARHLRNQTIAEMAASIGVPEQQLQKLEHPAGEPSELTIARVSVELGLPREKPAPRPRPTKTFQRELFPLPRSGSRFRTVEVAAYDVAEGREHEVDLEVTFTARPSMLERLEEASLESGLPLATWLLEAAREKLAREARHEEAAQADDRQGRFAFANDS